MRSLEKQTKVNKQITIDEKSAREREQTQEYKRWETGRYTQIDNMRRIIFSEYTPEDAYGERAFDTAFELKELGALMAIFIPQDSLLRRLVETAESEDDFTKRSLRQIFLFLDEHPTAVKNGSTSTDSTRSGQTISITKKQEPKRGRGFYAHGQTRPSSNAIYASWGMTSPAEWIWAQNCGISTTAGGACSGMYPGILKCLLEDIYWRQTSRPRRGRAYAAAGP